MSEEAVRAELRERTKAMVRRFISALDARMRPQGFRRSSHSFKSACPEYIETFQVQGSPWNGPHSGPLILGPQEPSWRFYVNIAVRLADSEPSHGSSHAGGRINRVVDQAEAEYELTEADIDRLADRLVEDIKVARAQLPARLAGIRESASKGLYCPLLPMSAMSRHDEG
jgi:hypothetical protein